MNRIMPWCDEGSEYEADPRQAEKLIEELETSGEAVKAVATPRVKCSQIMIDDDVPLAIDGHTHFRGVAAVPITYMQIVLTASLQRRRFAGGCLHRQNWP